MIRKNIEIKCVEKNCCFSFGVVHILRHQCICTKGKGKCWPVLTTPPRVSRDPKKCWRNMWTAPYLCLYQFQLCCERQCKVRWCNLWHWAGDLNTIGGQIRLFHNPHKPKHDVFMCFHNVPIVCEVLCSMQMMILRIASPSLRLLMVTSRSDKWQKASTFSWSIAWNLPNIHHCALCYLCGSRWTKKMVAIKVKLNQELYEKVKPQCDHYQRVIYFSPNGCVSFILQFI